MVTVSPASKPETRIVGRADVPGEDVGDSNVKLGPA